MGENTITKPFGLVLIITAHMVFNDPSHAEVIGTLGRNITLHFIFNVSITKESYTAIYTTGEKKIAQYTKGSPFFNFNPQKSSVFYHITNLTLNHSNTYWASFFGPSGPAKSNEVQLIVEENNTSTATPTLTTYTGAHVNESSSPIFITNIVIVLAVLPVVLLVTVLPWLICSLVKPKEMGSGDDVKPSLALNKQQQQQRPGHSSTPTVQESFESSSSIPAPSVIYSVLDFPRRPPTVVEINPRDTEYAAVSYLPEKRYM